MIIKINQNSLNTSENFPGSEGKYSLVISYEM
jgi:hypothetical protein